MKTWKKALIGGTISLIGLVGAEECIRQDRIDYNRRLEAPEYQSYFEHVEKASRQLEQKTKELDTMAWKEITEKLTGNEQFEGVSSSPILQRCRLKVKQQYSRETYSQLNKQFNEIKPLYERPWLCKTGTRLPISLLVSPFLIIGGLGYLLYALKK
ncbi:Uncharacterised protein [uncultured archaeon]|nr:Uncharacterised protein [uncultured archaeon]